MKANSKNRDSLGSPLLGIAYQWGYELMLIALGLDQGFIPTRFLNELNKNHLQN